jgi:hypothetical protein
MKTGIAPRLLVICVLVVPLAACNFEACNTGAYPGLEVEVRDRATDEFLTSAPQGVAQSGTFQSFLEVAGFSNDVPPRVTTLIGNVGPGRYDVHLTADGYQSWDTAGVRVSRDDCGIRTTSFTASLQPVQ